MEGDGSSNFEAEFHALDTVLATFKAGDTYRTAVASWLEEVRSRSSMTAPLRKPPTVSMYLRRIGGEKKKAREDADGTAQALFKALHQVKIGCSSKARKAYKKEYDANRDWKDVRLAAQIKVEDEQRRLWREECERQEQAKWAAQAAERAAAEARKAAKAAAKWHDLCVVLTASGLQRLANDDSREALLDHAIVPELHGPASALGPFLMRAVPSWRQAQAAPTPPPPDATITLSRRPPVLSDRLSSLIVPDGGGSPLSLVSLARQAADREMQQALHAEAATVNTSGRFCLQISVTGDEDNQDKEYMRIMASSEDALLAPQTAFIIPDEAKLLVVPSKCKGHATVTASLGGAGQDVVQCSGILELVDGCETQWLQLGYDPHGLIVQLHLLARRGGYHIIHARVTPPQPAREPPTRTRVRTAVETALATTTLYRDGIIVEPSSSEYLETCERIAAIVMHELELKCAFDLPPIGVSVLCAVTAFLNREDGFELDSFEEREAAACSAAMGLTRDEALSLHRSIVGSRFEAFLDAALGAAGVDNTLRRGRVSQAMRELFDDLYAILKQWSGGRWECDLDIVEMLGAIDSGEISLDKLPVEKVKAMLEATVLADVAGDLLRLTRQRFFLRKILEETLGLREAFEQHKRGDERMRMLAMLQSPRMGAAEGHVRALLRYIGQLQYWCCGELWSASSQPEQQQFVSPGYLCRLVEGLPKPAAMLSEWVFNHSKVVCEPVRAFLSHFQARNVPVSYAKSVCAVLIPLAIADPSLVLCAQADGELPNVLLLLLHNASMAPSDKRCALAQKLRKVGIAEQVLDEIGPYLDAQAAGTAPQPPSPPRPPSVTSEDELRAVQESGAGTDGDMWDLVIADLHRRANLAQAAETWHGLQPPSLRELPAEHDGDEADAEGDAEAAAESSAAAAKAAAKAAEEAARAVPPPEVWVQPTHGRPPRSLREMALAKYVDSIIVNRPPINDYRAAASCRQLLIDGRVRCDIYNLPPPAVEVILRLRDDGGVILKAKARHEPVENGKYYSPMVIRKAFICLCNATRDEIRCVYDAQDECDALERAKWRRCLVAMEERKKKLERRRAAKRKRKEVSNQGAAAAEPQPVDWYDSSDSDK